MSDDATARGRYHHGDLPRAAVFAAVDAIGAVVSGFDTPDNQVLTLRPDGIGPTSLGRFGVFRLGAREALWDTLASRLRDGAAAECPVPIY